MTQAVTGGPTMAARGKITAVNDGIVHFVPSGTNYELHLYAPGYAGSAGTLVAGYIHVIARKIWTVPSGGNFIAPIFGTPRTIQGRVRLVEEWSIIVHAGVPIVVELPADEAGYDLANGGISAGVMVNLIAMPGARFEAVTK